MEVCSNEDVFSTIKWHQTRRKYRYSPLRDPRHQDRPPTRNPEENKEILIINLLVNLAEVGDIPINFPTALRCSLPFPKLITKEIQNSLLHAGNTAPGEDEISVAIMRHSWPYIKVLVKFPFSSCHLFGLHPNCFRLAILSMLQKLNKPDLSSPRNYRPIVFL